MQVSGVKGSQQAAVGVNRKQSSDSIIREAQDKIAELKERIKSLADDDTLDAESKAEQKKQLQLQISELNTQIRQRQAELRKQEYESKKAREGKTGGTVYKGKGDVFSIKGVNALLSAQNSIEISNDLGSLAKRMELTTKRLSREIQKDIARGADVSAKENILSDLKVGIANTKSNQVEVLCDANLTMNSAAEEEDEEASVEGEKNVEGKEAEGKTENGENIIESDGIKTEGIYDKNGSLADNEESGAKYEAEA